MDKGLELDLQNYGTGELINGASNSSELQDLQKAMLAGDITGRDTLNSTTASGSPLKIESLDRTLKQVTFDETNIVLWKKIFKDKAYNTVEEFNQQTSYGEDRGGFIGEGETPQEEDSEYIRRAQLVKYMGTIRSVSHVMTLVNSVLPSAIDKQAKDGTLWLLRKLERSLVYGDSQLIPHEFNGLFHQSAKPDGLTYYKGSLANFINSDGVIDMRGLALTEEAMELAMEYITENYGQGTDLFGAPKVLSQFTKQFYGQKLFQPNSPQITAAEVGQAIAGVVTNYGRLNLNYDTFLRKPAVVQIGVNSAANHNQAPANPTLSAVVVSTGGKYVSADAGDYFYGVRAINRYGKSALVVAGSAASVVAGSSVDLTVAAGSGSNPPATGFEVYRAAKGAAATADFEFLFSVSAAELASGYDGAAAGKIRDKYHFMAGMEQAFICENRQEVMSFKQLAPLMKMDLAVISPAYRFMILHYGTPMLFAPRKFVRFINVGTL